MKDVSRRKRMVWASRDIIKSTPLFNKFLYESVNLIVLTLCNMHCKTSVDMVDDVDVIDGLMKYLTITKLYINDKLINIFNIKGLINYIEGFISVSRGVEYVDNSEHKLMNDQLCIKYPSNLHNLMLKLLKDINSSRKVINNYTSFLLIKYNQIIRSQVLNLVPSTNNQYVCDRILLSNCLYKLLYTKGYKLIDATVIPLSDLYNINTNIIYNNGPFLLCLCTIDQYPNTLVTLIDCINTNGLNLMIPLITLKQLKIISMYSYKIDVNLITEYENELNYRMINRKDDVMKCSNNKYKSSYSTLLRERDISSIIPKRLDFNDLLFVYLVIKSECRKKFLISSPFIGLNDFKMLTSPIIPKLDDIKPKKLNKHIWKHYIYKCIENRHNKIIYIN